MNRQPILVDGSPHEHLTEMRVATGTPPVTRGTRPARTRANHPPRANRPTLPLPACPELAVAGVT
jgi:hypothetical protein